jgi:glycosyltransferase involved in cell wall biosynthesis
LIFAGRLVSDKGADLLLEALGLLKTEGIRPSLTLVGSGPEELALRTQAKALSLQDQVHFAGVHCGPDLARLLQQHRILVVPSRWPEPFGIVALEGLACGCSVVASDQGGLPEAAGPCGITFPNGDAEALAQKIKAQLGQPQPSSTLAATHLSRFTVESVTASYLERLGALALI